MENLGQLKAYADIRINDEITIYGLRVIEGLKGKFIGYPQNKYEKSGKPVYSPIVEVSEKLKQQIQKAVFDAMTQN